MKMQNVGSSGKSTKLTQSPVSQATRGIIHMPPVQPRDCSITTWALRSTEDSSMPVQSAFDKYTYVKKRGVCRTGLQRTACVRILQKVLTDFPNDIKIVCITRITKA